ncbi:MAG: SPOR domain-containing protein [Candidatus Acidiferrales bacterium]
MAVASLVLASFIAFDAYRFRPVADGHQTGAFNADKKPELPSSVSASPEILPFDPSQPLDNSAFVLQVGAMAHKDNADALAESLRKEHFPVFVSKPGTNHLYLVMVGPFHDTGTMAKVKEDLTKLHIDAIRVKSSAIAQP